MKVLSSWLHEFLDTPVAPEAIAAAFDDLGTPVEEEIRIGEGLDGIEVVAVLALSPHPNADKIQLVDVDRGDGEALQICCGAFNMAVGDRVPLATLGTVMPGGMKIERRKLRGEWSNGMLCSGKELGLGDDHSGIMILPADLTLGTPITDALGIEPDVLWELEVNPNRPDAMSVAGLARDVAAKVGVGFRAPAPPVAVAPGEPVGWGATGGGGRVEVQGSGGAFAAEVVDTDGCGRFVARVLRGVDATAESPAWMQQRLAHLGMRSISAMVDISNYVMLELGQPNHPYDLAKVGGGTLRVRRAVAGETLTTLDDVERTLTVDDLLICDGDDRAVGIAGIMGGAECEISDTTDDVLLEMAWFDPISISRSSRRLGLRSEASARFEKGVDPAIAPLAADRFCQLAAEICGATTDEVQADVVGTIPGRPAVRVRTSRVNAILGTELTSARIAELLAPIGFTATAVGDDHDVEIPTWRFDSATEIDVIEEVGRHHGYRHIPNQELTAPRAGRLTPVQLERRSVRRLLCGLGLAEMLPLPFLAPGQLAAAGLDPVGIELLNPLVAEESILRTALLPGLVAAVAHNHARRQLGIGVWEIGHVFLPAPDGQVLPDEREHLAVVLAGREAPVAVEVWQILAEQLRLEGPSVRNAELPGLHPTRGAEVLVDGVARGIVGEIDPAVLARHDIGERVAYLEVDLGALYGAPRRSEAYRQISRFPSSDIDLAFVVPEGTSASDVEAALTSADPLVWSVRLFDVYRGAGIAAAHRSLAFAVRLQSVERTLTDAEVADVRARLIAAVEGRFGATIPRMIEVGPYRYTDGDAARTLDLASTFFHLLPGGFPAADDWPAAANQARAEAAVENIGTDDPAAALAVLVEEWFAGVEALRRAGTFGPPAVGAVTGLFTSGGGVPKTPQDELVVSWRGAQGDVQRTRVHHGRPWQALCLWSAEVVDQFAAAGNPIYPGAAGENISLSGISWDRVLPGVHLRVGDVLLVISAYAIPCQKNAQWFTDGRFDAMHHRHGPISRAYATVLEPGTIRMGDAVLLEPPS